MLLAELEPIGNILPEQQIAIYQNNARGALQACLKQIFPMCCKILGENYFKQIAKAYIYEKPSTEYDLNHYGDLFSDFIEKTCLIRPELSEYSYLKDLAQLEWYYHDVYYVENSSAFDFQAFASLTPEQQNNCRFVLAPCVRFLSSSFPVFSIWETNLQNRPEALVEQSAQSLCIYRENNQIKTCLISPEIYDLLKLINSAAPLHEFAANNQSDMLPELINRGWVHDFKVTDVQ